MIDFLIKSTISMGLLLAVYHLVLQKEKMHRFNRWYLLGSIIFSLALPFVTIEIYSEAVAAPIPEITDMPEIAPAPVTAPETDYLPYIGWGIYGLVTLVLILRFIRNVSQLTRKIKQHETTAHEGAVLVLLDEAVLPHTFLHYIFISRAAHENRRIEPELFTHELVHVNQKHTLDILFIESLKTLFWFNPLLYFYKKAIQLNHEFLADEIVIAEANDVIGYQQLLLQKATPLTYYPLASSLNFSVTKKRFTMMTKATTRSKALVLKLASLPVIAGLIALLCIETVAQEKPLNNTQAGGAIAKGRQAVKERRDAYYSGVRIVVDDNVNKRKVDKKYEELTEAEKDGYMLYAPEVYAVKHPTKKEFESFKNKKGYALQIDGKDVDNSILNKYKPEDFAYYSGYTMSKKALTKAHPQIFHYQLYTPEYFEKYLKGTNDHYPEDTFTMAITSEKENEKAVAEAGRRKTFNNVETAMDYLQEDNVYSAEKLDVQPEFPGGINALYNIILKNFRVPDLEGEHTLKIFVSFVVEKNGRMSDIKVIKDPGHGMGEEAVGVLGQIKEKWTPGKKDNKVVRTFYTLPINIVIQN
ncbi:hypothetical protein HYN59_02300 [Flavobacterium album]|uniref:Peptidase M56 domain-containing protein n=1 Tax=Flavobacterium album TaxID=2175091 RepID=A0A2S1QUB0_9FLAO|nr:M56 family metallopeptidase [Flavobacterium album]AWH84012.1 hypothetical protein HYN59_02300 [Flavobacterium album]